MSPAAPSTPRSPTQGASPRIAAARDLVVGALPLALVAWASSRVLVLGASYLLVVVGAYIVFGALVVGTAPATFPGRGVGPANRVTLLRTTLALPVAGLMIVPGGLGNTGAWWAAAASALALALDGIDGRVARATGTATPFGARLDMEVDAFLILVLSVLVWTSTELGPWVVAIGGMRYAFVASGWIWGWMRAPLPPSRRRQTVCVVQILALLACLAPLWTPRVDGLLAATALAVLSMSFAVDVAWLVRHARPVAAGR